MYIINIKENINIYSIKFCITCTYIITNEEEKKKKKRMSDSRSLDTGIFLNKTVEIKIANIY